MNLKKANEEIEKNIVKYESRSENPNTSSQLEYTVTSDGEKGVISFAIYTIGPVSAGKHSFLTAGRCAINI